MNAVSEMKLSLEWEGCRVDIAEDGSVGELFVGRVSLQAVVPLAMYVFTVDGHLDITTKKKRMSGIDGMCQYQLKIGVVRGENGVPITIFSNNNLRLLDVADSGLATCYEVALVGQDHQFFVTTQKTWSWQSYHNDGTTVCPEAESWPQMDDCLRELYGPVAASLPALTEVLDDEVNLQRNEKDIFMPHFGRVAWYNLARQMGMMWVGEDREVRVFWGQCPKRPKLRYLKSGELVQYDNLVPVPGNHQTQFTHDAVGIALLI